VVYAARPAGAALSLLGSAVPGLSPPEEDVDGSMAMIGENDRHAVSRMLRLVFDVVAGVSPGSQVMMAEHADINEGWYQSSVVER
jgi:hypothetical protein